MEAKLLLHQVATSYVFDKESRFLLVRQKRLDKWLSPGGHLETGEYPHEAALRELFEETGLVGQLLNLGFHPEVGTPAVPQMPSPFCLLREDIPDGPHGEYIAHLDFVYTVWADPESTLHLNEEISGAGWFTVDEIAQLDTVPNVKTVCQAIIEKFLKTAS